VKVKVYTAPAIEPVTATEAKAALSIDGSDRDTQVTAAIVAAREAVEAYTNRALITQTLEAAFDEIPGRMVILPRPRLISVSSVTYYPDSGSGSVVDADDYHVDSYGEPGGFTLTGAAEWPTSTPRTTNMLVVRYVAGYGATAADVPRALREAIIETVRAMIDGTEDPSIEERRHAMPSFARKLARPYRIRPI